MKVLVIGGGGREHALVWKIAQSPKVGKIYCAPGNAGIAGLAECVPIGSGEIRKLLAFVREERIDLTIVGPEAPLSEGIVDAMENEGYRVFGPTKKGAEIESSKYFAKKVMEKYDIPTAVGMCFTDLEKASAYVRKKGAPLVVKADGLAAGKGVIVCGTEAEALEALERIMVHKEFGEAGKKVVIEEFLVGEEASFMVMTDGETVLPLPTSQDHKAAFDGDRGPNTGGMGAYSPAPVIGEALHERILQKIMVPVVRGMAAEGRPYKGVLYAGLMIDGDSVKVLEFNARFGDPEAQPMLMRIKNDLVPLLEAVIDGRLREHRIDLDPRSAVCVVMASGGYPGGYEKGVPITGLEGAAESSEVMVFHAGTSARNGKTVTAGGRVLGVTALGATVMEAIGRAYGAVSKISFKGAHFRKDIGMKAVKRDSAEAAVGIVMGSDSDLGVMKEAADILKKFGVPYEMTIASAHRSPERALRFASGARERGMKVIIAGAGHAAHLAGVLAAHTSLPVIGVPIDSSCLQGLDALLSTVQMPPGVPVATVSIGKSGARNAGILAVQILGVSDAEIAEKLDAFKKEMAEQVEEKAKKLAEA